MKKSDQKLAALSASLFCITTAIFHLGCVPPDDIDSATTFSSATNPEEGALQGETTATTASSLPDTGEVTTPGDAAAPVSPKPPKESPQGVAAVATNDKSTTDADTADEPSQPATTPKDKPTSSNAKPEKVTFDNLVIGMQKDIVFRPFMMTEEAKSLVGQVIQIPGYMSGGVSKIEGLEEFILLRNTECKFGPGGQADHLIQIKMQKGKTTNYTKDMLYVQGTLEFKPFQGPDGNTWSIYEINDGAVVRGSRF